MTDQDLANYQIALLEYLDKGESAEDVLERLKSDPVFTPYLDYIGTFDLRMVEVASELVRKWGRREASSSLTE